MGLGSAFSKKIKKKNKIQLLDDLLFNIIELRTKINQALIKKLEKYNKSNIFDISNIDIRRICHITGERLTNSINQSQKTTNKMLLLLFAQRIFYLQSSGIRHKLFYMFPTQSPAISIVMQQTKNNLFLNYSDIHGQVLAAASRGFMIKNGTIIRKRARVVDPVTQNIKQEPLILVAAFFKMLASMCQGKLPQRPDLIGIKYWDEVERIRTYTKYGFRTTYIKKKIDNEKLLKKKKRRKILHPMRITKIFLRLDNIKLPFLKKALIHFVKNLKIINFRRKKRDQFPLQFVLLKSRKGITHNGTRKAHKRRI